MMSKQLIDVDQGSTTLVCKFVQKLLLWLSGACLNLFDSPVLAVLMYCIIIMQLLFYYCCIQYRHFGPSCLSDP